MHIIDCGRWSPFRPFVGLLVNYRVAREVLGARGQMSVLSMCIAAGLASVLWRHDTLLIGIVGGLLVTVVLFVRTGAYREYLAAIEAIMVSRRLALCCAII